ncbi:hypothetical protein G6514_004990 [Epicoccum nigrum]|nr:hypothetical protein G6514_004990 [Epicoccum nigrum]
MDLNPLFAPMLYGHECFQHFGPIAPPPRKDQNSSVDQHGKLSPDPKAASAGCEKPKKKHRRHNRARKRHHCGSKTEPEPITDDVKQETAPFHEALGTHQLPSYQHLQNLTFIPYVRPEWLQKPMNVVPNSDGTHRFDYAPNLQHLHVMSYLHWPKALAYHIVPELFQFNPRAYHFFPGRIKHKMITNKVGERGVRGTGASRQSWDEFIEEQKAAIRFRSSTEDLFEFWGREQAWVTW